MRRRVICLLLSVSMVTSSVCPAQAASNVTVQVNSVVQLGDNVVVGSNAITQSELMRKYEESKSDIASNYSDVDSNRNKIFDDLVPPVLSEDDMKNRKKSEPMTFEEFMEKLGYDPELPSNDPEMEALKKKYEKSLKKRKKQYELTEEDIKAFDELIRNGINPLTGEPFPEPESDDLIAGAKDMGWNHDEVSFGDALSWFWNLWRMFSDWVAEHEKNRKNEFDDKYKKMMYDYLRDRNARNLEGGYHWFVDHEECDKDEYADDELVYDSSEQGITKIKYRCAKCGKLYGYDQFCDCDKYLDGSVFYHNVKNSSADLSDDGLADARNPGEFEWTHDTLPEDVKSQFPADSKYDSTFYYYCEACMKTLTINDIDQIYMSSEGLCLCSDCYKHLSEWGLPILGARETTDSKDESDWGKKEHWEKYIHPCKAVYPEANFLSLMDSYKANLSDEAKADFDEKMAVFEEMSDPNKTPEKALNDYIDKLSKSKDKDDQKRAKKMKESYAEYKETYEAYKKADGKEAFIDGLIIDSALERGDFAMIDHEKVVSDNYKNDTLVYEEKNDDITDIQYRCAACGQLYGFNKKCGCEHGKYLDGSAYYYYANSDDVSPPGLAGNGKSGYNVFSRFEESWLGANAGLSSTYSQQGPMVCTSCGKTFCKDSVLPTTDEKDRFYFASNGDLKCSECMHSGNKDVDSDDRDSSEWSIEDPYYAPFISVCTALSTEESRKNRIRKYIDTLEGEERIQAEMIFDNLFNNESENDGFGYLLGDFLKSLAGVIPGPNGVNPATAIAWMVQFLNVDGQMDIDDNYAVWSEDDMLEMYRQMKAKENEGGMTEEERKEKESEYAKEAEGYKEKYREDMLKKAKEEYDKFLEKEKERDAYKDIVSKGIFNPDMTQEEAVQAFRDYVAGYTSVTDKVTLVTTVDYTDIQNAGKGGSYDVKGNVRATVTDKSGNVVAEREAVADMPMVWVAYEVGRYFIKRTVDVYHIEWNFMKCTATINAALVLPDGSSYEVISGREVTRIIENKDGFKQTNCQTFDAGSFVVNVVEGNINTKKSDFYDTERVR